MPPGPLPRHPGASHECHPLLLLLVLPLQSIAEQYFPRLEAPSGVTISAADLEGRAYTFKWRFWVNNSSRMYLLEGAGELHRNYGLEVGGAGRRVPGGGGDAVRGVA